jgi:isoleucyl-tRNA synthetase
MSADAPNYKDTLHLPQTGFPMRGDLVENEPKRLARWEAEGLYERILARRRAAGAPPFILHDGPPFANGDVHMGTALNKLLKDMVVKSRTMAGHFAPFIPGWDCHGLPIEFKVVQQARGLEPAETRRRCAEFATRFIDIQRQSFRRLGVFGDWQRPYLTMDPAYEAEILRVFATLVENGVVYQAQKPVQWSYGAHTALAEAEVEYQDQTSPAVFVRFPLTYESAAQLGAPGTAVVIWTTTPWTLPANLALAVHPEFTYIIADFERDGRRERLMMVRELVASFEDKTGWRRVKEEPGGTPALLEVKGATLEHLAARHPFLDRTSQLILGEFIDTGTGTGVVHIAPGHGADDYAAGQQYGLGVLSPVDDDGRFTAEVGVPEWAGLHVFDANEPIIARLGELGMLLGRESYRHQYPHCWRSKTPVIFRAVEQFFIAIDGLRGRALEAIERVQWLPAWGRNRIAGTVEARPDWCISRQRTWGVPLPVFFRADGSAIVDAAVARKLADLVERAGTNVWFEHDDASLAAELGLPAGVRKGRDTLDVWIDSGCSHVAVLDRHPDLHAPADLYLEATDQHRGWFQSSLMLSVAVRGREPYKAVLTHGFVVDLDKRKLSKSEAEKAGKPIDVGHFVAQYGADIVRLWVSSVDWQNEVPFGEDLFKQIAEPYRRIRNTLRILLGNLDGFEPDRDRVGPAGLTLLDRWILERLHEVVRECRKAYDAYEFRKVFNQLNQFCTVDLSAVYIDALKDRMYCDAADSPRRRAAQTAMHGVFTALCRLLAPVLVFTADEAWDHAPFTAGSVHEQDFPAPDPAFAAGQATALVNQLLEIRHLVQAAIEPEIQARRFTRNNEAAVQLTLPADHPAMPLLRDRDFATEFLIVAELELVDGPAPAAAARRTSLPLCPRCRRHEPVFAAGLCDRCGQVC